MCTTVPPTGCPTAPSCYRKLQAPEFAGFAKNQGACPKGPVTGYSSATLPCWDSIQRNSLSGAASRIPLVLDRIMDCCDRDRRRVRRLAPFLSAEQGSPWGGDRGLGRLSLAWSPRDPVLAGWSMKANETPQRARIADLSGVGKCTAGRGGYSTANQSRWNGAAGGRRGCRPHEHCRYACRAWI